MFGEGRDQGRRVGCVLGGAVAGGEQVADDEVGRGREESGAVDAAYGVYV